MELRLKLNCFSMVTNGSGSGLKFFKLALYQHVWK